jgi:hypothetical protein
LIYNLTTGSASAIVVVWQYLMILKNDTINCVRLVQWYTFFVKVGTSYTVTFVATCVHSCGLKYDREFCLTGWHRREYP